MTLAFKDGWFMVLNATFNNISVILWWSVLLVEETKVPQLPPSGNQPIVAVKNLKEVLKL
jgi:hypothetical protein